jgi:hypothetical protein
MNPLFRIAGMQQSQPNLVSIHHLSNGSFCHVPSPMGLNSPLQAGL